MSHTPGERLHIAQFSARYPCPLSLPSISTPRASTLQPRLKIDVIEIIAEFKRSIAVERIGAGLAAAKAPRVKLGRPVNYRRGARRYCPTTSAGLTGCSISKDLGCRVEIFVRSVDGVICCDSSPQAEVNEHTQMLLDGGMAPGEHS
jgi:hypothetical protein